MKFPWVGILGSAYERAAIVSMFLCWSLLLAASTSCSVADEGQEQGGPGVSGRWSFHEGAERGPAGMRKPVRGFLFEGKKEGIWLEYDSSGKLEYAQVYKDGLQDGPNIWISNSGEILSLDYWKAGLLEGPCIAKPSGGGVEVAAYVGGRLEGPFLSFFDDGRRRAAGAYKLDQKDGLWSSWSPDGSSRSRGNYRGGRKVGVWEYWDEAGVRTTESYDTK